MCAPWLESVVTRRRPGTKNQADFVASCDISRPGRRIPSFFILLRRVFGLRSKDFAAPLGPSTIQPNFSRILRIWLRSTSSSDKTGASALGPPEAEALGGVRFILLDEFCLDNPFRLIHSVAIRNVDPQWKAVLRGKRLSVPQIREHDALVGVDEIQRNGLVESIVGSELEKARLLHDSGVTENAPD